MGANSVTRWATVVGTGDNLAEPDPGDLPTSVTPVAGSAGGRTDVGVAPSPIPSTDIFYSALRHFVPGDFAAFHRSLPNSRPLSDEPLWRSYIRERLNHFNQVRGRGYPRGDALQRAYNVAEGLLGADAPAPNVLPSNGEKVRMIWSMAGWYVELNIDRDDATFFADDASSGEVFEGRIDEERELVRGILGSLKV